MSEQRIDVPRTAEVEQDGSALWRTLAASAVEPFRRYGALTEMTYS